MRTRAFRFAMTASLLLLVSIAAPAGATTYRTASAVSYSCPFGFCTHDTMGARWQVDSYYAEGHYSWLVSNFALSQVIYNGRATPSEWRWYPSYDVTFYNSAGSLVASFHNPPSGSCGTDAANGQGDLPFGSCETLFDAPYSATKLKIHWRMDVTCGCGNTVNNAFSATTGYIAVP